MRIYPIFAGLILLISSNLWGYPAPPPASKSRHTIDRLKWATPNSWPLFIDQSGKGLYADVLQLVFAEIGISIERETLPWKRALHEVHSGKADITGAQSRSNLYTMANEAIFEGCEIILRTKNSPYKNLEDLMKKGQGAWMSGYISAFPHKRKSRLNGIEVKSRTAALQMLTNGRVDYYLDNETQMNQTLHSAGRSQSQFTSEVFFCTPAYMVFSPNERGRILRDLYDSRIKVLRARSALDPIYTKWGFKVPRSYNSNLSVKFQRKP